jgi:hemerythrin
MMASIRWSKHMHLGIDDMDRLHRCVFANLLELETTSDLAFESSFNRMLNHLEQDFYLEDQWMADHDYDGILPHREQHALMLSALHHVHVSVQEGSMELGRAATELVTA